MDQLILVIYAFHIKSSLGIFGCSSLQNAMYRSVYGSNSSPGQCGITTYKTKIGDGSFLAYLITW